jgi:hypothetical protein
MKYYPKPASIRTRYGNEPLNAQLGKVKAMVNGFCFAALQASLHTLGLAGLSCYCFFIQILQLQWGDIDLRRRIRHGLAI